MTILIAYSKHTLKIARVIQFSWMPGQARQDNCQPLLKAHRKNPLLEQTASPTKTTGKFKQLARKAVPATPNCVYSQAHV